MALRDLFDSDKRSKEELRQLLEDAEAGRAALHTALAAANAEKAAAEHSADEAQRAAEKREAASQQREASLDERDESVAKEEKRIRQATIDLDASSKLNSDHSAELELRSADLRKERAVLDERTSQLTIQRRQLDVLTHQLINREHAVQQREGDSAAKEKDLGVRENLLKSGEAALSKERARIAPRLDALADREQDLRRWELQRSTIEKSLTDARSAVTNLERIRADLTQRITDLLSEVASHRQRADAAERRRVDEAATHREKTRQLRELRAQLKAPLVLRVNDTDLFHALASLHAEPLIEALGNEPVTLGTGPWEEADFDSALEQAGFVPQLLDETAADFEVFVVGREGVDIDALAGALETRLEQELPVRLYSQELWLLYLMTGVDPLSLDPEMLQRAIGSEHPILLAFVNEVWQWPLWPAPEVDDEGTGDSFSLESGASPLHEFGYRAGKRTTMSERRANLKAFLLCKSLTPYFDPDHHDAAYPGRLG